MRSHCANTPIIQHPFTDRLLLLSRWLTIEFIIFFYFARQRKQLCCHITVRRVENSTFMTFFAMFYDCFKLNGRWVERKIALLPRQFFHFSLLLLLLFLIIFESIQWFSSHFEIIAITYRVVLHNLLFLFSALCDWRSDWQHNIIDFRLMCRT